MSDLYFRVIFLLTLVLAGSSCSTASTESTFPNRAILEVQYAEEQAKAHDYEYQLSMVTEEYDSFKRVTNFESSTLRRNIVPESWQAKTDKSLPSSVSSVEYFLRATKTGGDEKEEFLNIQLVVLTRADSWLFFDRAFADGRSFGVTQIDQRINSVPTTYNRLSEIVGIDLSLSDLRRYSQKALLIKIEGKYSDQAVVLELPTIYVKAFADAIEGKPRP